MNDYIVKWNTARIIDNSLKKLVFFKGYKSIHSDLYDIYKEVESYSEEHYSKIQVEYNNRYGFDKDMFDEWISHLDKLTDLQIHIEGNDRDDADIAKKTKELFDSSSVTKVQYVDLEILNKLNILLEYSESVRNLFNYIVSLYSPSREQFPYELEQEIREVLDQKGLGNYKIPETLLNNNNKTIELS